MQKDCFCLHDTWQKDETGVLSVEKEKGKRRNELLKCIEELTNAQILYADIEKLEKIKKAGF